MSELRYIFRTLIRSDRGFTAFTVATIAIAVVCFSLIFEVTDGILFRGLAFHEPSRLVLIRQVPAEGRGLRETPTPRYQLWSRNCRTLEAAAFGTGGDLVVFGGRQPQRVRTAFVEPHLLSLLGTAPVLGRLTSFDWQANDILITWSYWRTRFGATENAVGTVIETESGRKRVMGVLPREFVFPHLLQPEILIPLRLESSDWSSVQVVGRMKKGFALPQVREELESLRLQDSAAGPELQVLVTPLHDYISGPAQAMAKWWFAAVGFFLLIAFVNSAALVVVRNLKRRRNTAVREALGASRWQLFRPVLTESCLLSGAGAVLGLIAYTILHRLALSWAPPQFLLISPASMGRVAAVGLGVCLVGGVLIAGLSAVLIKTGFAHALTGGGERGSTHRVRWQQAMLLTQAALTMILLAGAGLLMSSLLQLLQVDVGLPVDRILVVRQSLPGNRYPDSHSRNVHFEAAQEALAGIQGVHAVGATNVRVLGRRLWTQQFRRPQDEKPERVAARMINRSFLQACGIDLVQGSLPRDFDGRDDIVLVNQAAVARYWPDQDPLGAAIEMGQGNPRRIIGVVRDSRLIAVKAPPRPELFLPFPRNLEGGSRSRTLVVRTSGDPDRMVPIVRQRLLSLDDQLPAVLTTLNARVKRQTADDEMRAYSMTALAGLALLLVALGCFGLVSYAIQQRTREIGIRIALGATRSSVLLLMLRQGALPALLGALAGLAAAWTLSGYLADSLYQVDAKDLSSFLSAAFLLVLLSVGACLTAAKRATRLDPACSLRQE